MGNENEDRIGELVSRSLRAGDPTGWFEELYTAAAAGEAVVPWDRDEPSAYLVRWAEQRGLSGDGRSAVVVGCGLGRDAEYLSGLGFATTGFDVSATAIATARRRHPDSAVTYRTADLFDLPAEWLGGFDLVVEDMTVQALPDPPRHTAIVNVGRLVADGGTLLAIALARGDDDPAADGPPFTLRREEIDAFATVGLRPVLIEDLADDAGVRRWRAEFRGAERGAGSAGPSE